MNDKQQKYKFMVGNGHTFSAGNDDEVKAGEIVTLTAKQAIPFADFLTPIGEPPEGWPSQSGPAKPKPRVNRTQNDAADGEENSPVDNLEGNTVSELKKFPEWEFVSEPKPTKKKDIIAAIVKVMEG